MTATSRLVQPKQIPPQLYDPGRNCLRFADGLARAYRSVLDARGLLAEATTAAHDSGVGGAPAYEAERHFMTAYSGSCARIKLAMLDPNNSLQEASNTFIRSFAGGRVGLLDIPCGGGAAAAALLCTLAELRARRVLPALPLEVQLVGGDVSDSARGYAQEMFAGMDAFLRGNGIVVSADFREWDVCDAHSTSSIVHRWMGHAHGCREHFVLTANCSGFLQDGGHFKRAHDQLNEIFRYAILQRSTIAWIEPQTKGAMGAHWPRLMQRFLPTFAAWFSGSSALLCADSSFLHPLREDAVHKVRVSLVKLETKRP